MKLEPVAVPSGSSCSPLSLPASSNSFSHLTQVLGTQRQMDGQTLTNVRGQTGTDRYAGTQQSAGADSCEETNRHAEVLMLMCAGTDKSVK